VELPLRDVRAVWNAELPLRDVRAAGKNNIFTGEITTFLEYLLCRSGACSDIAEQELRVPAWVMTRVYSTLFGIRVLPNASMKSGACAEDGSKAFPSS